MKLKRALVTRVLPAAGVTTLLALSTLSPSDASSHREAPLISEDPAADITDVYAFVSPDNPDTVTLIGNFIPFEEPAGGPNFHRFGNDVLYSFKIDNDGDAVPNVTYEFRFRAQNRNPNTFLYNTGPIDSLTDPSWNRGQSYTVTEVRGATRTVLGTGLSTVPANVGPRSIPDYSALAEEGVHELSGGDVKVYAGPVDDPFFVDLGEIFDLAGLGPFLPAHVIPSAAEPGEDYVAGYNVHTIALQVPIEDLTAAGDPVIGVWATTHRRQHRTLPATGEYDGLPVQTGPWVQVARLGNPLVNEVVIPVGMKNRFNNSRPLGDAQFAASVVDPELGQRLPNIYPGAFSCFPTAPRNDLVTIFLTGIPGLNQPDTVRPSEQLRLNTSIPPSGAPNRLGVLGGDLAGFPNGRRLADDVTDIELRAVAGATPLGDCDGESPNDDLEDDVDTNDKAFQSEFPYVAEPNEP